MEPTFKISTPVLKNQTIAFKTQKDYFIIHVEEIIYCKADGSYSVLKFEDGSRIVISKSLTTMEQYLKGGSFIRCHNSYLVNAKKIKKFNCRLKTLLVFGENIPVSRRKCAKTIMKLKALIDQDQKNLCQI